MTSLTSWTKVRLTMRIWLTYLNVRVTLWRGSLPRAVEVLGRGGRPFSPPIDSRRLGAIINKVLKVGPLTPRCLSRSLVLYHLVRQEDASAALLLGLPANPEGHEAHAWVELGGMDIGPPPGGRDHEELARYP